MYLIRDIKFSILFISFLIVYISGDTTESNVKVLLHSLEKCGRANHDIGTCLRLKAVTLLERALKTNSPMVINDYMSLMPSKKLDNFTIKTEKEIEELLPTDANEKEALLDEMIADKVTDYLQSRSLQFNFPKEITQEGRKKKNQGGMMLLMGGLGMGAMMVQLAMGKIALLAGKALLVGKMALLLSAIIGLKKLLGNSGGGDSHQVVYATESHGGGGHHGGGWGRNFDGENVRGHKLAYSAQARGNSL